MVKTFILCLLTGLFMSPLTHAFSWHPQAAKELEASVRYPVEVVEQWHRNPKKPFIKSNGGIVYFYDELLPVITCKPLHITDIQLEPGEVVTHVHLGDQVRWHVAPAASGVGSEQVTHLAIKPTEPNLNTSVLVTTSKRTYALELRSGSTAWMPQVSFAYPEYMDNTEVMTPEKTVVATPHQALKPLPKEILRPTDEVITLQPLTAQPPPAVESEYQIKGHRGTPWTPTRVYQKGLKTYIDFPPTMTSQTLPVLVLLDHKNKSQLVNYRLKGNAFEVDAHIRKAALMVGVGRHQQRVVIERKELN